MAGKRPKRPKDTNQLAKHILDLAAGNVVDPPLGRVVPARAAGGKIGGRARANKLSPLERKRIAKAAADARWGRKKKS